MAPSPLYVPVETINDELTSPTVKSWSTSVASIFEHQEFRLDASHYDPEVSEIKLKLETSGFDPVPLSTLASVFLRGQFTRIWAQDEKHGLKYLNATDLLSLMALGVPSGGSRYLSYATETNLDALIVRAGWLLMSCSGTIGRVFYVPKRLDGWAATHDLIRIVPKREGLVGFLMAWLNSRLAQSQILSHTHGGQIDHVTDKQIEKVLIPVLSPAATSRINQKTLKALEAGEAAMESLMHTWQETDNVLNK
jgi:Type I restriction modification DNA specificity domain